MQAFTFPIVSDIISQAVSEAMGSTQSALTALQTTALIRKLDSINRDFVNAAHTRHSAGGWSWLEAQENFQTYAQTTLNGAITTSSTSVVLTSTLNFPTSGRLYVRTTKGTIDFLDWTGKSSNTLTGVTGIDIPHATGEYVEMLYALPTDYAKVKRLIINTYQYFTYLKQETAPYYATFYTKGAYLFLPQGIGSQDASLWYERKPTDLFGDSTTNSADNAKSLDIPEDFEWYAVNMLCAYILRTRRKDSQAYRDEAMVILDQALSYDAMRTTGIGITPDY